MANELLVSAGVLGAILLTVARLACQEGWVAARERAPVAANLVGGLLLLASVFAEWSSATALFAAQWTLVALFGLRGTLFRRSF